MWRADWLEWLHPPCPQPLSFFLATLTTKPPPSSPIVHLASDRKFVSITPSDNSVCATLMTEGGVCAGCVTGFIHDGTPKGTTTTIAKLPTYIAKPTTTRGRPGVIVIITDVFGWNFVNSRLLADEYAERSGRTIYVPDFLNGNYPSINEPCMD